MTLYAISCVIASIIFGVLLGHLLTSQSLTKKHRNDMAWEDIKACKMLVEIINLRGELGKHQINWEDNRESDRVTLS